VIKPLASAGRDSLPRQGAMLRLGELQEDAALPPGAQGLLEFCLALRAVALSEVRPSRPAQHIEQLQHCWPRSRCRVVLARSFAPIDADGWRTGRVGFCGCPLPEHEASLFLHPRLGATTPNIKIVSASWMGT
jgi:hypothetical protein